MVNSVERSGLDYRDPRAPDGAALDPGSMKAWPNTILGGLPIVAVDKETAARGFIAHVKAYRGAKARPFYSTSANGEVLSLAGRDPEVAAEFLLADQIHADGMPMVLYSRLRSRLALPERVATTDLVHVVAGHAAREKVTFYFLGGEEDVNRLAVEAMRRRYPGLLFAGRHHGYFGTSEEDAVVRDINRSAADILWVGMGVPLEQRFIRRNLDRLTAPSVVKTCGGLFDFLSGRRARAPRFIQAAGLEWAYRAAQEPRRLGTRYILTNPRAIKQLILHSG